MVKYVALAPADGWIATWHDDPEVGALSSRVAVWALDEEGGVHGMVENGDLGLCAADEDANFKGFMYSPDAR